MEPDTFRRASLAFLLGLGLLAGGVALPLSGAAEDMAMTNSTPRGASQFAQVLRETAGRTGSPPPVPVLDTLASLAPPSPRASLVVIAPATPFSDAEGRAVARFLREGGRVLVADDLGVANTLLERLPTRTRIAGDELIDLAYSRRPQFPVLYSIAPHPLTDGVDALVANAASTVRPDANATILVASSSSSWLDADGDGIPGPGDARGPHAVLTTEPVGAGELVVLADPSILSNEMLVIPGNLVLAKDLAVALSAGAAEIHIDESHRPHRPFAILAGALPAASAAVRGAVLVLALAVPLGAWAGHVLHARAQAALEARRGRRCTDPVETVLMRNPHWRARDVKRVAAHLTPPGSEPRAD